ncbi:MAG TPA: response regulator [Candidatus Limnocylindria bacterium]
MSAGALLALLADHSNGMHTTPVAECSGCTVDRIMRGSRQGNAGGPGLDAPNLRFAVIEDSPVMLQMLEEIVRDHFGTEVDVVRFARRPEVDALAATEPSVVILDLLFGEQQTGLDVLRGMRADPRLDKVPVLVVTASRQAAERYLDEAPAANAAILMKPFSLDDFHETLDALLSGTELAVPTGVS